MNEIDDTSQTIIAPCGDICSNCPRYQATQANDIAKLEYLAELWHRLGYCDYIPESKEMKCDGCNQHKVCANDIKTCKNLINKANCGECDLFPCDKISQIFENTEKINEIAHEKCSETEYKILKRAFFLKKELLTEIHRRLPTNEQNTI
jgi:hypothetical protein